MTAAARRLATYEDLLAPPENMIGEILDGELYVPPRPALPHALATSVLGVDLGAPLHRGCALVAALGGGSGAQGRVSDHTPARRRAEVVGRPAHHDRRRRRALRTPPGAAARSVQIAATAEALDLPVMRVDRSAAFVEPSVWRSVGREIDER